MHGTHTRSQNHSFSGLLTGIRGAEEKKPGVERISMPLRETWESDGNQGWKDGVPGSQAPRESRKEEGNTGNKKALPGTRMGSAGRTGRRNKRFGDKKWGSRSRMLDGNPQRLMRRRATLPHPVGCSTIAVPGLSFRVRNGTGRLTWAMAAANLLLYGQTLGSAGLWRPGNRTADADMSMFRLVARQCSLPSGAVCRRKMRSPKESGNVSVAFRPLVPVGSTPRGASTSGLSTTCSAWGLQELEGSTECLSWSRLPA